MLHTRMPQRIHRQRTKGWRKPAGAVSICRPGPLGNPFKTALAAGLAGPEWATRRLLVDAFAAWLPAGQEPPGLPLADGPATWRRLRAALPRIVDHDVMCWCPLDQPCHGDVLLPYARRLVTL
ncbi:DUF4326 domain-containing protein [Micromonospora haikouensis]|uniref:DUF4326 domain-containing protein n=1 Tax=Micromonospora haikouensis TaxID=686309 RepID=UPI003D74C561